MINKDHEKYIRYFNKKISSLTVVDIPNQKNAIKRDVLKNKLKLDGIEIQSKPSIEEAINYSNKYPDLEIIPGIELSTDYEGAEIHMLGFYINYKDKSLQKILKK